MTIPRLSYQNMEVNLMLLTLHEAARLIQEVPRTIPGSVSRKMPDVHRTHKELGKAALLYEATDGKEGLRTVVEGKRRRKVYKTDLRRWRMQKDKANGQV